MKNLFILFLTITFVSCGNDNSELYLILRDENKELFNQNNELVKSIEEKNQLIDMKIDSIESKQKEDNKTLNAKINKIKNDFSGRISALEIRNGSSEWTRQKQQSDTTIVRNAPL